jgi:membrane protein implicated in regulation of membrane protease activity
MAESTIWWLLTGAAVAVELLTGTFYLLMLAIGLAAAALAAHLGAPTPLQFVVAALVGGGAVVGWHLQRQRGPKELPAAANRDVNLDIGETVQVSHWKPVPGRPVDRGAPAGSDPGGRAAPHLRSGGQPSRH